MPPILKLLSENKEQQLLEDIFKYFEEILNVIGGKNRWKKLEK